MAEAISTKLPDAKKFYSDATKIGSKDKNVGWYNKTFSGTPEDTRQLLEGYSGIQSSEVDEHVCTIVRSTTQGLQSHGPPHYISLGNFFRIPILSCLYDGSASADLV